MLTRRELLSYAGVIPAVFNRSFACAEQPRVSARAREIHAHAFIFDGHVHALDREFYHGGSMGSFTTEGQWDLQRAREGGVGAFFLSAFVPEEYYPGRYEKEQALRRIRHALSQLELNHAHVELALTGDDIVQIRAKGKIAAVLDLEGSYDLDGDLGVLRELYGMGLRSAQLSAHNWDQNYADACCSSPRWGGLTDHGRAVIREMNRLGMVINVSHSSDHAIAQAIEASEVPVIATHHGLRSFNNIPRNMPDDLLSKLAAKGGVFGLQIGTEFVSPREYVWVTENQHKAFWDTTSIPDEVKGKTIQQVDALVAPHFPMLPAKIPDSVMMKIDDWVAVLDRVICLVGDQHVAIGTDFDGGPTLARGMRDVRDLAMVTDAMLRKKYLEERINKIWGANLLTFFERVTHRS